MAKDDFALNKLLERISDELKQLERESRKVSNQEHILSKHVSEQSEPLPKSEENLAD